MSTELERRVAAVRRVMTMLVDDVARLEERLQDVEHTLAEAKAVDLVTVADEAESGEDVW